MIGFRSLSGCSLLFTLFLVLGIPTAAWASDEAKPFAIKHAEWRAEDLELRVNGEGPRGAEVTISYASSSDFIASARINDEGKWQVRVRQIDPVPCRERNAFPDAGPGQAAPACLPVPRIRMGPSPFQAKGTLRRSTPPRGRS